MQIRVLNIRKITFHHTHYKNVFVRRLYIVVVYRGQCRATCKSRKKSHSIESENAFRAERFYRLDASFEFDGRSTFVLCFLGGFSFLIRKSSNNIPANGDGTELERAVKSFSI